MAIDIDALIQSTLDQTLTTISAKASEQITYFVTKEIEGKLRRQISESYDLRWRPLIQLVLDARFAEFRAAVAARMPQLIDAVGQGVTSPQSPPPE